MRELTPPNLDRIPIQREEGRKSHARKAATNNKKKAQGRTPTHTGARSQVPDQKKPSRAKAQALKGEGKGELHAGCKGERGGDAHFPLQKRLMGNISNSFLIRCACSFNALESNFLKTIGVPIWVWIYSVRTQSYHMKSQR